MRSARLLQASALLLVISMVTGCDRFGAVRHAAVADGAPDAQELQKISYMSADDSGPHSRKLYTHFEEAKSCGDFELAMRWNRPPNVAGGMFHKKMIFLGSGIPAALPKNSEVFIKAKIVKGQSLSSGSAGWLLRMQDGTLVQAIEMESFLDKQTQTAQDGKWIALVAPYTPHRAFCGTGVYQGLAGQDPASKATIPLISLLYAMDRDS